MSTTHNIERGTVLVPPIGVELDGDAPPPITSIDELITRSQLSEIFGVTERTLDQWRYGRGVGVRLPYFRLANKVYLWHGGVIWWLNKQRRRPDEHMLTQLRKLEGKKNLAR